MQTVYKRFGLILLLFFLLTAATAYLVYRAYSDLNRQLISRTALLLGKAVEDALRNTADKKLEQLSAAEKRRLRALMDNMTSESGSIIHILLINPDMKILLSSDRSIEGQHYKSSTELKNILSNQPLVLEKTWQNNTRVLDVILPLNDANKNIFGYLRLVISRAELTTFFSDLFAVFVPLILVFGLLLFYSFYLARKVYRKPLESLKNLATRMDKGDYSYRIDYQNNDEFTSTFQQLNKTIERVSILDEGYKQAARRISKLLHAVDESVLLLDENLRVTSYNEAARRLFRTPDEETFDTHFRHIYNENTDLKSILNEARQTLEPIEQRDVTIWLPDDSELLTRLSLQLYTESGKVTSYLLSFKDVALLEELQNNLNRSMKFGVIAGLASSVSHEIKNPLSAMAIHADILNTRIGRLDPADENNLQKSLSVLQNEIKRLNRITHQFFNLARVRRSDLTIISLNSVINDVLLLVQQQTIERNISLESALESNIEMIYGDPDQLKQVFLNLLLNAFQAIERDGTVQVRSYQQGATVLVEIEDDGAGMDESVQGKLFELYFTTKEDGGGIGLAVSKNIMQAHGGFIRFSSTPGKGTCFTLGFPRKEQTTQLNLPAFRKNQSS